MQDNQTIYADTHLIFQFAEKGQLYNLTKDVVQNELSLPYTFIQQFEQQQNNQVSQSKQFLCQLTDIVQNPFNILIKQKIKSLLIDLFQAGETIPEILLFIKLTKNIVCLSNLYQFEQKLQNKFKSLQKFQRIEESYIQIFQQQDELIIQITLNVVYEAIKNNLHIQTNLNSRLEIFEQIKFANKEEFSLHGKQILILLNEIKKQLQEKEQNKSQFTLHSEFQQSQIIQSNKLLNTLSYRIDNQSKSQLNNSDSQVHEEKAKQYILKFFILILVEKEIILPNLIKLIRFRERSRKTFSKSSLENRYVELKISPSALLQISMLQQIKEIIQKLQIDPSITNSEKQNYYIIRAEVEKNYPQFINISYVQSIIMALELIYQKTEEHYQQLQEVFQDQHVEDLMRKIEKMYGSKFIEMESQKQNIDNMFKTQDHARMIEIGYMLNKIYQRMISIEQQINFNLQNEKNEKIVFQQTQPEREVNDDKLFVKQQKSEKEKKSIYIKQEISYAIINKIFFQFVSKLTENGIPFPFILQVLKLCETRLLIRYPIEYVRKLTLKKKFIEFVKDEYGLEMTKDKHINVENLKEIDKQKYRRKEGCFWYPIIYQQCLFIYDYREHIKCKLKNFAKMSNYQELIKFCAYEYETNQQHLLVQKALRQLIDYINSLQN